LEAITLRGALSGESCLCTTLFDSLKDFTWQSHFPSSSIYFARWTGWFSGSLAAVPCPITRVEMALARKRNAAIPDAVILDSATPNSEIRTAPIPVR